MRLIQRLICYFRGHDKSTEYDDTEFANIYVPTISTMSYHTRPYTQKNFQKGRFRYQIIAIPEHSTVHICSRCNYLCWSRDHYEGSICDISHIPGLEYLFNMQTRLDWETEQRKANGPADRLYHQYLMLLKLGR